MTEEEKKDQLKNIPPEIASRIQKPAPHPAQRPAEKPQGSPLKASPRADETDARPDLRAVQARKAADAAAPAASAGVSTVIKHVWTRDDTYASLAFKYYGSNKEPYWRLIYNHNKAIIGNHPNDIRVGLEIEIPPLPDELKKK